MLKSGLFITPQESYTVYEIEEPGFYRIDFIRGSASFQIDYQAVVYSQVHRKTTYVIGDSALYDSYLLAQSTIQSAKMNYKKESQWNGEGQFVTTVRGENNKLGFVSETKQVNGSTVETSLISPEYTIMSSLIDPIYGVKLEPVNFSEYRSIALSNDTVTDTESNAVFYSLDVLKRRYDLSHIEEKDFVVATDLETARKRLEEFHKNPCPVKGFDTETTGVDVDMYGEDKMVGIILGADANTSTYFPFRHTGDFNLPMYFLDDIMKVLKLNEGKLVAHNKKFDRKVMMKEGYDLRIKWDTMQLSIVLNPVIGKGIHSLKHLIYELNGKHFLELDEIFLNSRDIDFSVLPIDIIKYYACADATNVVELLQHQLKILPKYQYKLAFLECDLSDVKADQEYYGIRVDVKKYEKQYKNCNYIIDMLLKAFRTLTKEDGNINSNQVLIPLIYNRMKCKVLMRTQTGLASTSSIAIKKLAKIKTNTPREITEDLKDLYGKTVIKAEELANSKYPALVILAKYREYNKLKTAFYARFERTMKTGRIFFWVNQNGAATGRQSSPMHQLPKELKEVILSDAEDRDFWGPDFSQIELRMIAYLAGETDLIELSKDPDNDIHRIIGSLISDKEMWAITPEERSTGKRRNFGVVYLISKFGLAGQLFGPGYTTENSDFAGEQLDAFYHKFKRIDRFIKNNGKLVQKLGYMETAWFHRRRLFPEIFDPDIEPRRKASILRMANNVPVQGTSADYLKVAENQMYAYIREKGWNTLKDGFPLVRMMLSIHDEIIISSDNSIPYEEIVTMIAKCMETPVEGAPPFFACPALMSNWEDHNDDSLAMPVRFRDKIIEDYARTHQSIFKSSYYRLVMPDAIKTELNNTATSGFTITEAEHMISTKELVARYYDKCTLVFDHGDYGDNFTVEHVKEALNNYIESGFTLYTINNYRLLLQEFRDGKLKEYMSELIKEYGTDYKVVGEHVRHPSLTHDLIANYHKQLDSDLSHEEKILESTRLYIEALMTDDNVTNKSFVFNMDTGITKPTSDKDLFQDQLEVSVNFDENGEVIFVDADDEDEDVLAYGYTDDPDDVIYRVSEKPTYVWELADAITFDVQQLLDSDIDKVLSYVYQHKDPNGFFKVYIIYKGKLVDTGMLVEHMDIEEANDVVIALASERIFA